MIQRHIPHAAGTFRPCQVCARQPHHIVMLGCAPDEPYRHVQGRRIRHTLECAACRKTTTRHDSLADAMREWRYTATWRAPTRGLAA